MNLLELVPDSPAINYDFALNMVILSLVESDYDGVKTWYFDSSGNPNLQRDLATILFQTKVLQGHSSITTNLSEYIPEEIRNRIVGMRKLKINGIGFTKKTILVEDLALSGLNPQTLLFNMLDEGYLEYIRNDDILGYEIDEDVLKEAKRKGYMKEMESYFFSREFKLSENEDNLINLSVEKTGLKLLKFKMKNEVSLRRFEENNEKQIGEKQVRNLEFTPKYR
jgi:hypothetical protein